MICQPFSQNEKKVAKYIQTFKHLSFILKILSQITLDFTYLNRNDIKKYYLQIYFNITHFFKKLAFCDVIRLN